MPKTVTSRKLKSWPITGGLLERFGLRSAEIDARSRSIVREIVGGRFEGTEADLVAAMVYATGDPDLVNQVALSHDPVGRARSALGRARAIVVDVTMVSVGIRLPAGQSLAVAVRAPGAESLARSSGTTRAAAGMKRLWDDFGRGGLIVIGNAPTALLAVLDLAATVGPPACVIATFAGLAGAEEAKEALVESGLPHLVVRGSGGGIGVAVGAVNHLLGWSPESPGAGENSER